MNYRGITLLEILLVIGLLSVLATGAFSISGTSIQHAYTRSDIENTAAGSRLERLTTLERIKIFIPI
jgi:type II secretory pathway pseudopilin PulG